MKTLNIQIDYLRRLDAIRRCKDKGKPCTGMVYYHADAEKVALADGCLVYFIPKEKYFLTLDMDAAGGRPINLEGMMPSGFDIERHAKEAKRTGRVKELQDNIMAVEISGNGVSRWVNKKNLEYFDKDCQYMVFEDDNEWRHFIAVFEWGGNQSVLAGLVLEIRMK